MSSVVHPKGPLPPQVYWRRRLIVIGIVVLVVIVIAIIAWPRGNAAPSGGDTGTSGSSQTPGATGTPSAGPTGAAGDACDPTKVQLTADTDKTEYAAGELPQLWLTLENKSAHDCVMQIGGEDMTYVITSPSGDTDEVYWTTADCADPNTASSSVTLKPGVPVESSSKVTWNRVRSTPGNCEATGDAVGSDGASFDFTVKLGDLSAKKRIYLS